MDDGLRSLLNAGVLDLFRKHLRDMKKMKEDSHKGMIKVETWFARQCLLICFASEKEQIPHHALRSRENEEGYVFADAGNE